MAGPLPTIEVTDSQGHDVRLQGASSETSAEQFHDASPHPPPPSEDANSIAHEVPPPSVGGRTDGGSTGMTNGTLPAEEDQRTQSQTTIDPLSHHILKRTHTENTIPQKLRSSPTEPAGRDAGGAIAGSSVDGVVQGGRKSADRLRGDDGSGVKEKKKGVSFLSRIIGAKKKDVAVDSPDNESEAGERRTEGMDAHVFSQPITSNGFTPHHPPPPKYIKVRTHNKKTPDFNRVFLAQELHRSGTTKADRASRGGIGPDSVQSNGSTSATWALEFSIDGRFLAVGGQDRIVRVWAVISTVEEREAHENEEDSTSINSTGLGMRLNAPVFKSRPTREYEGHTSDVLDLSWSKNNFLLSSSMDKTVRLWHVSRMECLCCFKHSDFVTSISFHPRDDRFFLAGSLDSKLRLWSIPDKSVAYWNHLPDLVTAVAFTPDGKTSIAGCLNGFCLFYETEGLKYSTQIHVRSAHGRNTKGSKITGIQTIHYPPHDLDAEVKLLITSNDSRIRLYNFRDKSLETKFRGNENTCSQIHASFSDDTRYVICGSEDRKVYLWSTGPVEGEKKEKRPVEMFTAHSAIVTAAVMAPLKTRQMLGRSGDPIYDLCNPPPVTLVSRTESRGSSRPPTESDKRPNELSMSAAATLVEQRTRSVTLAEESPSYIARSAHQDGDIIVSADYMGSIKVFRQDCAYSRRRNESWDTSSTFSKKIGSGILNRSASIATRNGAKARRASTSSHQPSDRIISWRNGISSNTSLDNVFKNGDRTRSTSPRKLTFTRQPHPPGSTPLTYHNAAPASISTSSPPSSLHDPSMDNHNNQNSNRISNTGRVPYKTEMSHSIPSQQRQQPQSPPRSLPPSKPTTTEDPDVDPDPLMLQQGDQSLAFWNFSNWNRPNVPAPPTRTQSNDQRPRFSRQNSVVSAVSALSSEMDEERERLGGGRGGEVGEEDEGEQMLSCRSCGSGNFKAMKVRGSEGGQRLVCTKCGTPV